MKCRLCLSNDQDLFNIFQEEGLRRNVAEIISKYFWFEVYENDPISSHICQKCWTHLDTFNTFYLDVEQKLTRVFKEEKCQVFLEVPELADEFKVKSEIDEQSTKDELATVAQPEPKEEKKTRKRKRAKPALDPKDDPINSDKVEEPSNIKDESDSSTEESNDDSDEDEDVARKKPKRSQKVPTASPIVERYAELELAIKNYCVPFCDICNLQFEEMTWTSACEHFSSQHKMRAYVFCCGRKFTKKHRIMAHIAKHLDPEVFQCPICQKSFTDDYVLASHVERVHRPKELRPFPCAKCPRRFLREYDLQVHCKKIHSKKELPCPQCDKVLGSKQALKSHIQYVHEDRYMEICEICAKTFRNKTNYENHKRVMHAEKPLERQQCPICKAWAKNAGSLRSHMHRHANEGSFECDICGKISTNKAALKSHKRYVHLMERTFQCTFCEKSFKMPVELREHLATHTGEMLYYCPVPGCTKSSRSHANLMAHKKKNHREFWEEEQRQKMTL